MKIEPRYWLIEFAASMPKWMGWLAAWLVNREADRLERIERRAIMAIGAIARKFAPRWDAYEVLARAPLHGLVPYQHASQLASLQNAMAAQSQAAYLAYQNQLAAARNTYGGAGGRGGDMLAIGSLFGPGYGGGGNIP